MSMHVEPSFLDTSAGREIDFCAREPIHIPGAIQPNGAFLAVLADSFVVTHASANLAAILGPTAESVLGCSLRDVVGEAACRGLIGNDAPNAGAPCREHVLSGPNGKALHLRAYRSGSMICLDIQPAPEQADQLSPFGKLQSVLDSFEAVGSSEALCEAAVRGLHRISGYDRVMAYRFDADGNGEVIAEALDAGLEPYLGLHYPASDVPQQARLLYLRQRVGAIADASYEPVPLLVDPAFSSTEPLDLTHSTLRSVSPFHRAYMRNMGTIASLTIALIDGPQLWGMLVCHNSTARVAGPSLRAVADIIGQVVSLLICTLGEAEKHALQLAREGMLLAISEQLAAPVSLSEALDAARTHLLDVADADGVVVRISGVVFRTGQIPPEADRLLDFLIARNVGDLIAINDLAVRFPEFFEASGYGGGALLLPLGSRADQRGSEYVAGIDTTDRDAILWFRPERVQTVTWGGDPTTHVISELWNEQYSPRTSFAAWKEIAAGRCIPWTEVDKAMACRLHAVFEGAATQRAKAALARLRHYDALTGLPNRSLLQDLLTEASPGSAPTTALLFLDLDRFKAVNDTMGHAAGDSLLIELAQRLVAVVGPDHLVARLGGDEFVVLCRRLEPDAVAQLAERIRTNVEAPFKILGRLCHVAASIGTAIVDQLGGLDLIRAADMAMYAAKQRGGNRGVVFEPELFDRAARQFALDIDLRQALATGDQLVLLYQPMFKTLAGKTRLSGFEALVRWRHPVNGWMSPALFIPLAEKSGLILALGDWVLATAVRQAAAFQRVNRGAELSMSVNISALQLAQPGFYTSLAGLFESEDLSPTAICLEVTESVLTDAAASKVLADIRTHGSSVAIDDFGIGYSSLSSLRSIPADIVKLDGSFLESVQGQSSGAEFVGAVTTLAHAAGKSVVFEGIETKEQFDIALVAGADMVQGFFFAPPLSANAAQGLVDRLI